MVDKEVQTNQTEFTNVEPILENQPVYDQEQEKSSPTNLKKIIIGSVASVSILLAIVLGLYVVLNPQPKVEQIQPSSSPVVLEPVEVGELEQVFRDLQADLKAVDPSSNVLLFPPVTTEIFIDTPER